MVDRRGRTALKATVLACALALGSAMTPVRAQTQLDVDELMVRVGNRVAEFYTRAKNVICIETSTVLPIDYSNSPDGFARTVESELHVEADSDQTSGEAAVVRKIRKVNGRAPNVKDKKNREGCTDPNPLSPEPLAFLLPGHRSEYQFKTAGISKGRNQTAWMIDFISVDRRSNPELIEDPGGHDDCFDWSGHIASRGRVWVDAGTYDVVRVDRNLGGPVDVKVPVLLQRRHNLNNSIVIVRDDQTIRYKTFAFSEPDEILLLPESIDSLTMVRGGLQSTRRHQSFSDYKRFVTAGRVLE
jgi:hypothetical protein